MTPSTTETSGPSLEQILWRALDRFREKPALVDALEFAEHVAHAFDTVVPEEEFAERFLAGSERLQRRRPRTIAEAVVRASGQRLHVYEFDLDRLEYVIVEDKHDLVVVSRFGQFSVPNGDSIGGALDAAVITSATPAQSEPRGYFVRKSGAVAAIDVRKVARTLERASLRQVSFPRVGAPGKRLSIFHPVRRPLTEERERRALLEDPLLAQPLPPSGGSDARGTASMRRAARRAAIGAVARWQRAGGRSTGFRIAVQTGDVLAIVSGGAPRPLAGESALERSEALAAVREGAAPVAALASRGQVPELAAAARGAEAAAERFWVQPEEMFRAGAPSQVLVSQVPRPGEVPASARAAIAGGATDALVLAAARESRRPIAAPRTAQPRAAIDPAASRAVLDSGAAPGRAGSGTPRATSISDAPLVAATVSPLARPTVRGGAISPRTGALPAAAFQALQLALERTAAFADYRLPPASAGATPSARAYAPSLARHLAQAEPPSALAGSASRLVFSLPFPNAGEMHVGADLSQALQAYLAAPVQPMRAQSQGDAFAAAQPPVPPPAFVAGQTRPVGAGRDLVAPARPVTADRDVARPATASPRARAEQAARRAVASFELPAVRPLVRAIPSISALPALLRRAIVESGTWMEGPGAPLPLAVRELADEPALAAPQDPGPPPRRPVAPGEEEVVIPLPLWARMGRTGPGGAQAGSWQVPVPAARAPLPGEYRLAAPSPTAFAGSAPPQGSLAGEVAGPAAVRVVQPRDASGAVTVTPERAAGLARLPPIAPEGRRRLRVGAPVAEDRATLVSGAAGSRGTDVASSRERGQAVPTVAASLPRATLTENPAAALVAAPAVQAREPVSGGAGVAGTVPWVPASAVRSGSRETIGALPATAITSGAQPWRRPVALRFRYVESPLWWVMPAPGAQGLEHAAGTGLRAGLAEATVAAGIWRSMTPAAGLRTAGRGEHPAIPAPVVAAPPAPQPGPAYIVMSSTGAAGAVPARSAALARTQAIDMSIVAAIPPAPPPLETMGLPPTTVEAPRTRRPQDAAHGRHKEAEDAVSRSKIEGSVDAIAQRIYHRIRRRLQSDRERFGG